MPSDGAGGMSVGTRLEVMFLAIDTSAGTDVAVVTDAGRLLAEYRLPDARRHAEAIGVAIEQVLREAGLRPRHLDGIVCGMGPGPFTGLRVGVAAARTFAFAAGIRLHPVASHDAIAHEWRHGSDHTGPVLVTTDARRRELAASRYEHGELRSRVGFTLIAPGDVAGILAADPELARADARQVSAHHLTLAWLEAQQAQLPDIADDILYLRAPDATPGAQPKRVTA